MKPVVYRVQWSPLTWTPLGTRKKKHAMGVGEMTPIHPDCPLEGFHRGRKFDVHRISLVPRPLSSFHTESNEKLDESLGMGLHVCRMTQGVPRMKVDVLCM